MNKKKSTVKKIYLAELTLEEGWNVIESAINGDRTKAGKIILHGEPVHRDWSRWEVIRSWRNEYPVMCFNCGCVATHWIIERHRNDVVFPYNLNLYSGERMLTWDHIIPKSLGGSNHPKNGRCACERCNNKRGNDMSLDELLWINKQEPLKVYVPNTKPWSLDFALKEAKWQGRNPGQPRPDNFGVDVPFFGNPVKPERKKNASNGKSNRKAGNSDRAKHQRTSEVASQGTQGS